MKQTRWLMGMPITVEIVDASATAGAFDALYDFFAYVDATFSPYKADSEVMRIRRGELALNEASDDMQLVLALAEQTRQESGGFFDIWHQGQFDPTGVVKGWAIDEAASLLARMGFEHFFVDAGGDIQVYGKNHAGDPWRIGICNPFNLKQVVKTLVIDDRGVATSGPYLRGAHIHNPLNPDDKLDEVVSLTVIGLDVCEADRLATAAFAMGRDGILFIESLADCEGYLIDRHGTATMTTGFDQYVAA